MLLEIENYAGCLIGFCWCLLIQDHGRVHLLDRRHTLNRCWVCCNLDGHRACQNLNRSLIYREWLSQCSEGSRWNWEWTVFNRERHGRTSRHRWNVGRRRLRLYGFRSGIECGIAVSWVTDFRDESVFPARTVSNMADTAYLVKSWWVSHISYWTSKGLRTIGLSQSVFTDDFATCYENRTPVETRIIYCTRGYYYLASGFQRDSWNHLRPGRPLNRCTHRVKEAAKRYLDDVDFFLA